MKWQILTSGVTCAEVIQFGPEQFKKLQTHGQEKNKIVGKKEAFFVGIQQEAGC